MSYFDSSTLIDRLRDRARPSPVSVCFCGRSSAGSWQIRGEQIAATRENWKAINFPTDQDIQDFDIFCIVKKPDHKLINKLRMLDKPFVFDIVDSWAQPEDGLKFRDVNGARQMFSKVWGQLDACGYIFPTRRMQVDLGFLVAESTTIYHHFWPWIRKNPMRASIQTVGYVGGDYLGSWKAVFQCACEQRGLNFVSNPREYTDMDVVIWAREGAHGSFLAKNYKSNVKLANAYGSGTPALVHVDEMSAHDTDTGEVLFFSDQHGSLERQLDRLVADQELRYRIHDSFLEGAKRFQLGKIADQFEAFFKYIYRLKERHSVRHV